MSKELKLFWENNPDTPLDSSRLSEFINEYSEDGILECNITDFQRYGNYGDGILKAKSHSKVAIKIPKTIGFFDFKNSLSSHNSIFSPAEANNVVFRDYTPDKSGSIYIGEAVENIFSNPGFENTFTDWNVQALGSSTCTINSSDSYPIGSNSASITIDQAGNRVELYRSENLSSFQYASFSFFYKSEYSFNVRIQAGDLLWKGTNWSTSLSSFYTIPSSNGEWKRFEVKNINIGAIPSRSHDVRFYVYSENAETQFSIDSFQLEEKRFCSAYTNNTRGDSNLKFEPYMMKTDSGLIDFSFMPKNAKDLTLFSFNYSTRPALELYYERVNQELIFRIYNTDTDSYIENRSYFNIDNYIDKWIRVIVSWKEDDGSFIISEGFSRPFKNFTNFVPYHIDNIENITFGESFSGEKANIYIDKIKFNYDYKEENFAFDDFGKDYYIDGDEFKIVEIDDSDIIIDESLLDTGNSFEPNMDYYVWITDNRDDESFDLIVSRSDFRPSGRNIYWSRIIGGFKTDENSSPYQDSLWDISSRNTSKLHAQRLIINGTNSEDYSFDIRTTPYGKENDVRSKYPIHVYNSFDMYDMDHVFSENDNPYLYFDYTNIQLNSVSVKNNTVSTNNYYNYNTYSTNKADEIDVNDLNITTHNESYSVNIFSNEITLQSSSSDIKLDHLRVNDNVFYVSQAHDMFIDSTVEANKNLTIKGYNINYESDVSMFFNSSLDYNIVVDRDYNLTVNGQYNINVNGELAFEHVKIDQNSIYTDDANLQIYSTDPYDVNIESLFYRDDLIYNTTIKIGDDNTQQIDLTAATINLNSSNVHLDTNAIDFIKLDNVKFEDNKMYTDGTYDLEIDSINRIMITSSNRIIEDAPLIQRISTQEITDITGTKTVNTSDKTTFNVRRLEINGTGATNQPLVDINGELHVDAINLSTIDTSDRARIYGSNVGGKSQLHLQIGNTTNDELVIESWDGSSATSLLRASGNLITIDGNLNVRGTTNTLNSTITQVADSTFEIKTADTPFDGDASFEVQRESGNAKLHWNENTDRWQVDNGDGQLQDIIFANLSNGNTVNNLVFVSENQNAVIIENAFIRAGMEVLDDRHVSGNNLGKAIANFGIQTDYHSINSKGTDNPPGGWMSVDTRDGHTSFDWHWRDENSAVIKELAKLDSDGFFYVEADVNRPEVGYNAISTRQGTSSFYAGQTTDHGGGFYYKESGSSPGFASGESSDHVNFYRRSSGANHTVFSYSHGSNNVNFRGYVTAARVYNAVWNDLAECWEKDADYVFDYNMVVVQTENGIRPSSARAEKGTVGVVSNTYGYILGSDGWDENDFEGSTKLPIAISGRVNVKYNGKLTIGDEVVGDKDGKAVKANIIEKILKRERIIGIVDSIDKELCVIRVK